MSVKVLLVLLMMVAQNGGMVSICHGNNVWNSYPPGTETRYEGESISLIWNFKTKCINQADVFINIRYRKYKQLLIHEKVPFASEEKRELMVWDKHLKQRITGTYVDGIIEIIIDPLQASDNGKITLEIDSQPAFSNSVNIIVKSRPTTQGRITTTSAPSVTDLVRKTNHTADITTDSYVYTTQHTESWPEPDFLTSRHLGVETSTGRTSRKLESKMAVDDSDSEALVNKMMIVSASLGAGFGVMVLCGMVVLGYVLFIKYKQRSHLAPQGEELSDRTSPQPTLARMSGPYTYIQESQMSSVLVPDSLSRDPSCTGVYENEADLNVEVTPPRSTTRCSRTYLQTSNFNDHTYSNKV